MSRIFISYKRSAIPDEPLARALFEHLSKKNHVVFVDQGMLVGERWAERIREEIEACDYLVLLLSGRAIESAMVAEEVRMAEHSRQRRKTPKLLPVRLACELELPYELGAILNPLQYVSWSSEEDTARVIDDITLAVEGRTNRLLSADGKRQEQLPSEVPLSAANPKASLEAPEGTMATTSAFYVTRYADATAEQEQRHEGYTLTIKGPRQMGKSSLLGRVISRARERGDLVAFIDFQMFGRSTLADTDETFHQFCFLLEDSLGMESELGSHWRLPLSPPLKSTRFMERRLLKACNGSRLVIAIDEADSLLACESRSDFFGMLRAWHNQRAHSPLWQKLSLAMVISTEPSMLIDSNTQSPFNVGALLELEDFGSTELVTLNALHGNPLLQGQVEQLHRLVGGHPYLSRKAMYVICQGRYQFDAILREADSENGPFGDHLRAQLSRVQRREGLSAQFKSALLTGRCDDEARHRLMAGGLLVESDGTLRARNNLYERYFRRILLG